VKVTDPPPPGDGVTVHVTLPAGAAYTPVHAVPFHVKSTLPLNPEHPPVNPLNVIVMVAGYEVEHPLTSTSSYGQTSSASACVAYGPLIHPSGGGSPDATSTGPSSVQYHTVAQSPSTHSGTVSHSVVPSSYSQITLMSVT